MRKCGQLLVVCFVLIMFLHLYKNKSRQRKPAVFYSNENSFRESDHLIAPYLKNVEEEIEERVKRVEEMCEIVNYGGSQLVRSNATTEKSTLPRRLSLLPRYKQFFWNRERRFAYCPVFKAGSTSWTHNMVRLGGYPEYNLTNPTDQVHQLGRKLYGFLDLSSGVDEETLDRFNKSLKLLIVRHPFERLVSAYQDKLSPTSSRRTGNATIQLKMYGAGIVAKYRKDKRISQKEPTWPEFVDFILYGNMIGDWESWDEHWRPATFSCTPCAIKYDFIAKTETLERDQKFLIWKMGLQDELRPQWDHPTSSLRNERYTISHQVFRQLSKETISKLYQVYLLDFILFGYNYQPYLDLGYDS